jgi:hypothetical protein
LKNDPLKPAPGYSDPDRLKQVTAAANDAGPASETYGSGLWNPEPEAAGPAFFFEPFRAFLS